jgi:hypothetical protein
MNPGTPRAPSFAEAENRSLFADSVAITAGKAQELANRDGTCAVWPRFITVRQFSFDPSPFPGKIDAAPCAV